MYDHVYIIFDTYNLDNWGENIPIDLLLNSSVGSNSKYRLPSPKFFLPLLENKNETST